jgi:DNA polymerase II large subunit
VDIYCPGNLILTVTEGAVSKYDDLMATLIERYGCNEYISGLYSQVSKWVSETFESQELGRQQTLM